MPPPSVVALTVCCADIYPELDAVVAGGNAVNAACACRRLGCTDVSVVGAVGEDLHGDLVVDHLTATGIDVSRIHRAEGATASNRIFIQPGGERYTRPGSWDGAVYDSFRLSESDWEFVARHGLVFIGSVDPNFDEALSRLPDRGCRLAVDFFETTETEPVERALPHLFCAMVNNPQPDTEAFVQISRTTDVPVVVTMGAAGSVAFHRGERFEQEALPVEKIADTTGGGDSFLAAFALSWLECGDIERALEAGAREAASVLGRIGGV